MVVRYWCAGARAFQDDRPQQPHQFREQPHRDHGRFAKIRVERIPVFEVHPVPEALCLGPLIGLGHEFGIDVDPPAAKARVHAGSRQRNETVTRPEIHDHVVVAESGHRQHPLDILRRARLKEREALLRWSGREDSERKTVDWGGAAMTTDSVVTIGTKTVRVMCVLAGLTGLHGEACGPGTAAAAKRAGDLRRWVGQKATADDSRQEVAMQGRATAERPQ